MDVRGIISLQNAVSHPKTQWDLYETANPKSGPKVIRNLERTLRGRFAEDTNWKGKPAFFPDRCLSSGCANWAVSSVGAFATEFLSHLGVQTITERIVRLTIEGPSDEEHGA
jgi:hypothetical protein